MSDQENDNDYSFVIGKVESFRDVSPNFGDHKIPFVLAMVDTALGVVPVAMGRNVFDLKELKVGCVIAMNEYSLHIFQGLFCNPDPFSIPSVK